MTVFVCFDYYIFACCCSVSGVQRVVRCCRKRHTKAPWPSLKFLWRVHHPNKVRMQECGGGGAVENFRRSFTVCLSCRVAGHLPRVPARARKKEMDAAKINRWIIGWKHVSKSMVPRRGAFKNVRLPIFPRISSPFFFLSLFGLIWAQWFSFSVRKQRKRGKKGAVFPVQGIDSESGGGPRPLAGGFAAVKRYVNGSLCRSCGLEMASANLGARPSAFDALERTRTGHWARLVGLLNHDVITSTPSTQHTQAAQKAYLGNLLTGCGSHIKLHSTSLFWIFEIFFFSFTVLIYANIFIHWIVLSVVCFKLGAS